MKHHMTITLAIALLSACAQTAVQPISDYNAPLAGKAPVVPPQVIKRPKPRPVGNCDDYDKPGTPVRRGHEEALCRSDDKPAPQPKPKKKPPTECSDAGKWRPGVRYATGGGKVCA